MSGDPDLDARVGRLADLLSEQGHLIEAKWRTALRAVPRHLFVPDIGWALPDFEEKDPYPIDRARDEDEWLDAVYSDTSIVTQIDDGAGDVSTGEGRFTSSASAPGVVCRFLELLDVRPGDRVLDIGTGTGWTSALLASYVGDGNVVTIEVDPEVADRARRNLEHAGRAPLSIIGDGADGAKASAPFDRVHVTCGVSRIPYAWVEQTRAGGVIVAPYQPGYGYGHKVRLDVVGDGTAVGRFHGSAGYMLMRSQRPREGTLSSFLHHEDKAVRTRTTLDPRVVVDPGAGGDLAISALAPGIRCQLGYADDGSGEETLWLLETTADGNGSWALAEYAPGQDEYEVRQYGPRRLWDEVHDAYLRWLSWGRPGRESFGLLVTPEHERIWLDDPGALNPGGRGASMALFEAARELPTADG